MTTNEVCPLCEEGYLKIEKSLVEFKVSERCVTIKVEQHSHNCNNCGLTTANPEDMKFNASSYKDALAAL